MLRVAGAAARRWNAVREVALARGFSANSSPGPGWEGWGNAGGFAQQHIPGQGMQAGYQGSAGGGMSQQPGQGSHFVQGPQFKPGSGSQFGAPGKNPTSWSDEAPASSGSAEMWNRNQSEFGSSEYGQGASTFALDARPGEVSPNASYAFAQEVGQKAFWNGAPSFEGQPGQNPPFGRMNEQGSDAGVRQLPFNRSVSGGQGGQVQYSSPNQMQQNSSQWANFLNQASESGLAQGPNVQHFPSYQPAVGHISSAVWNGVSHGLSSHSVGGVQQDPSRFGSSDNSGEFGHTSPPSHSGAGQVQPNFSSPFRRNDVRQMPFNQTPVSQSSSAGHGSFSAAKGGQGLPGSPPPRSIPFADTPSSSQCGSQQKGQLNSPNRRRPQFPTLSPTSQPHQIGHGSTRDYVPNFPPLASAGFIPSSPPADVAATQPFYDPLPGLTDRPHQSGNSTSPFIQDVVKDLTRSAATLPHKQAVHSPTPPEQATPPLVSPKKVLARLSNAPRFVLKSDIISYFDACKLKEEHVKFIYDDKYRPLFMQIAFDSQDGFRNALKVLSDKGRLGGRFMKLEQDSPFEPDEVNNTVQGVLGLSLLMQNLSSDVGLEDVNRFFQGYGMSTQGVRFVRSWVAPWKQSAAQAERRVIVEFDSYLTASRALREKQGSCFDGDTYQLPPEQFRASRDLELDSGEKTGTKVVSAGQVVDASAFRHVIPFLRGCTQAAGSINSSFVAPLITCMPGLLLVSEPGLRGAGETRQEEDQATQLQQGFPCF